MTEQKIAYEPHPVSPERKRELHKAGYRIIDARFDLSPKPTAPAAEPVGSIGTDSGEQFSDDQLRAAIEKATGKPAHPAMKRENLIAKFDKLNAEAAKV